MPHLVRVAPKHAFTSAEFPFSLPVVRALEHLTVTRAVLADARSVLGDGPK